MSWPSSGQMCVVGLSIPPGETSTAPVHPASLIPVERRSISRWCSWKATQETEPVEWGDDAGP